MKDNEHHIPLIEWITAAIGFIVFLATVGFLLYESFKDKRRPPEIRFSIQKVVRQDSAWLVVVEATNVGDETASQLKVRATHAQETPEQREVQIDYLPSHSSKTIGFYFNREVARSNIVVQADGYVMP